MYLFFISLIILFDQITKYFTRLNLSKIGSIELLPGYLSLTYVENTGAAFGIFREKKFILVGITSIIILAMIYVLYTNKNLNKYMKIALTLIIAGAIGNLIDRVYFGFVTDFIHMYIKNIFDWPVYNVADISVVCGTVLLAINILLMKEN